RPRATTRSRGACATSTRRSRCQTPCSASQSGFRVTYEHARSPEILRDIAARYRGQWAKRHLDAYLQARWKDELVAVSDTYHRFMASAPSPRPSSSL
ncbi:MAG: hypothetical protein ACLP01_00335, partial [Solirubrobacteraceae bacterium]